MMRRFGLHSNSQDADEIKDLPISRDFRNGNMELLLLAYMKELTIEETN